MKMPRVHLRLSMVRCHIINASCVVSRLPIVRMTSKPLEHANSLFAEARSARAWGACVLDQSTRWSDLGAWDMQVNSVVGPCDWVPFGSKPLEIRFFSIVAPWEKAPLNIMCFSCCVCFQLRLNSRDRKLLQEVSYKRGLRPQVKVRCF